MRKKIWAVAMFLILVFFVGFSFADDDDGDDNSQFFSLSFTGTGQDACMLTNVDDIDNPTDEFCDECDNGCGEIFTYYELDLIVAGRKVYGSLEWYSCFTKDSTGIFKCSVPIQSRLKNGRLLKDKRFGNIYVSFAAISEKPNDDDESSCESAVYRKYFTLLAIEDDFGYITRLEGGANSFEDEDCLGWSASEIERVVLDQISQ